MIQIAAGYTSYVDIYTDYYDPEKNQGRMERYKPIKAHRQAFEKMAAALNPMDRRFYFLSGSYGTGKSHLLLMMANYFAKTSDLPEIEAFFRNYKTAQSEVLLRANETLQERTADSLKAARSTGRYLVALCRYSLNLDFRSTLLRALQDALISDQVDIPLDTLFHEAVRRIKDWESRRSEKSFYANLETAISQLHPDWTVSSLISSLESMNEQALKVFRDCFHQVTDTDFTYDKDNLRAILTDFLASSAFRDHYQGIVFIYDEFGAAIDNGLADYQTLLDFSQYCANSTLGGKGGAVIFIGAGHKAFRSHGTIGDLNAETLEARVTEIGLQTQGMEDIIAAIVHPKKDTPEWGQFVQPHLATFTWFSSECSRLKLFNWLPAPRINNNIIQNIYPMHPLATYALLRLANEAGADNRSVFKFFAPEFETGQDGWLNVENYSYPWFIRETDIQQNGQLNFYTADALVDYFNSSLKVSNNRLSDRVKNAVANYEATLRALNDYVARNAQQSLFDEVDHLMLRIIKVMLIHNIITTPESSIQNTAQNIYFSLTALSDSEKEAIRTRLENLCKAAVIFNNEGVYELMRGDRKDVHRLIEQYKANPDNRPTNLLENFLQLVPLSTADSFVAANDYNNAYGEDKRFKVVFATPFELTQAHTLEGHSISYFAWLEHERLSQTAAANSYEGVAVYVFCENENDIETARQAVLKNDQPRIVVAIPRAAISVGDAVFTLAALESDWFKHQAQDFGPFENADLRQIREAAKTKLSDARGQYFLNPRVIWYGEHGTEIPLPNERRHAVVDQRMQAIFDGKRNTFSHVEFNRTHLNLTGQVKSVFEEAGNLLCDLKASIRVNWSWPDNRGGNKYLRRCFVDRQVLKVERAEGDVRLLEVDRNLNSFRTNLPAYAQMLESLAALEGQPPVNVTQFLRPYFEAYGQGEIAITLMLLLARRFYGDSLRFKREPGNLADISFNSTQEMLDLVQGRSPSAVIIFEPVSEADQQYFAAMTQIFTNQPAPAGRVYTIADAHQAMKTWWESLPLIARSLNFYTLEYKPLAELLSQASVREPFHLIKHDLLEKLNQTPGEILDHNKLTKIEVRLRAFKATAEGILAAVEDRVLSAVAEVFGLPTHLDLDIQEAMRNWYNSLSPVQRDPMAPFHNNDSKPLARYNNYTNIRDLLLITFPEAYSLGAISNWMSDFVVSYTDRIRAGKQHIETRAPQVGVLQVTAQNGVLKGDRVTYQGELTLHAETENGQGVIYYTEDGTDPANAANQQRKQLNPGDTLTIHGNRRVKLVAADSNGSYGAVRTIEAINELEKHKIVRPAQTTALDETITFVFPRDKNGAWITISSLLTEIRKSGIYASDAELRQIIQHILEELS